MPLYQQTPLVITHFSSLMRRPIDSFMSRLDREVRLRAREHGLGAGTVRLLKPCHVAHAITDERVCTVATHLGVAGVPRVFYLNSGSGPLGLHRVRGWAARDYGFEDPFGFSFGRERVHSLYTEQDEFARRFAREYIDSEVARAVEPAAQSQAPVSLFYSYSHRDERLRDALETHLSLLRRQGAISEWHDRRIGAGQELDPAIREHLERARVILLLISQHFLSSDYCWGEEMTRALEKHDAGEARVIPVILRPCDWKDPRLSRLLALPTDAKPVTTWRNRDQAWLDVVRGIKGAVEGLTATDQGAAVRPRGEPEEEEDPLELLERSFEPFGDAHQILQGIGESLQDLSQALERGDREIGGAGEPDNVENVRLLRNAVDRLTHNLDRFCDKLDLQIREFARLYKGGTETISRIAGSSADLDPQALAAVGSFIRTARGNRAVFSVCAKLAIAAARPLVATSDLTPKLGRARRRTVESLGRLSRVMEEAVAATSQLEELLGEVAERGRGGRAAISR